MITRERSSPTVASWTNAEPSMTADDSSSTWDPAAGAFACRRLGPAKQPGDRGFHAHAQLLFVGMCVMYRVTLHAATTPTPTSVSRFEDVAPHHPHENLHNVHESSWMITLSEAKFSAFLAQATVLLGLFPMQPQVMDREDTQDPCYGFARSLTSTLSQYSSSSQALFALSMDASAMQVAKETTQGFIEGCWRAIKALGCVHDRPREPAVVQVVVHLLDVVVALLAIPESIGVRLAREALVASADGTRAHDAGGGPIPTSPRPDRVWVCSICLEGLELSPRSSSPTASAAAHRGGPAMTPTVLPCRHRFHADCILAWLRHHPTCPVCRARVGLTHV